MDKQRFKFSKAVSIDQEDSLALEGKSRSRQQVPQANTVSTNKGDYTDNFGHENNSISINFENDVMLDPVMKEKKLFLDNFLPSKKLNQSFNQSIQTNAHANQSNYARIQENSSSISIDMAHIQQLKQNTSLRNYQIDQPYNKADDTSQINILQMSSSLHSKEENDFQCMSAGVPETVRQTSNNDGRILIDEQNRSNSGSSGVQTILSLDKTPTLIQNTLSTPGHSQNMKGQIKYPETLQSIDEHSHAFRSTVNQHSSSFDSQTVFKKDSLALTSDQILQKLGIRVKEKQLLDKFNKNFVRSVQKFKEKRKSNEAHGAPDLMRCKTKHMDGEECPKLRKQRSMANFMLKHSRQRSETKEKLAVSMAHQHTSIHTHQKQVLKQQNAIGDGFMNNHNEIKRQNSHRFGSYTANFLDLTKRSFIDTMTDVISVTISLDSKLALAVMQKEESAYNIRWYLLNSLDFDDPLGELHISGNICRTKEIEQNFDGTIFSNCYVSDGIFWVLIFNQDCEVSKVNISQLLGICDDTQPMFGFHDPLITASFVSNQQMMINCYHSSSMTYWHLLYNYKEMRMEGLPISKLLSNSEMNFPYKSFFDKKLNQVYVFFRHGQVFTIDALNPCIYEFQQLPINDLGQMYLVYDQALVARSSNLVLFLKQVEVIENEEKKMRWRQYFSLSHRGFIYHVQGNVRIQITTDNLIYFYIIDTETLLPKLENCMYNFMDCSQMMFGPRRKYCITYKTGQIGFNIYRKKYLHKFIAKISNAPLGGAFGVPINSKDQIMISNGHIIQLYCQQSYQILSSIKVPFCCTFLREDQHKYKLEILNMFSCPSDRNIVTVLAGTKFFQNDTISFFLFIYHYSEDTQEMELKLARDLPQELRTCSKQAVFRKNSQKELLFANKDGIYSYDFMTEEYKIHHIFECFFENQPTFICYNQDQTIVILATNTDVYYVNIEADYSVDIDSEYQISEVRSVLYAKELRKFYILANKCDRLLGYYLIEIDEFEPEMQEPNVLINWRSKLELGDASLNLTYDETTKDSKLVVCFKCIFINTYNIILIDLSSKLITFWYETYHLWESSITGIYLQNRKEFCMISQQGIGLLSLGNDKERLIQCGDEREKHDVILYPLQYCNDLILEKSNLLLFQDTSKKILIDDGQINQRDQGSNELVIKIQQQYEDNMGKTQFDNIYSIKVHSMTLRECLMLQSIISCRQQSDIVKLISLQPTADVFFKTFLEMQKQNLISILAFDSRCIKSLLSPQHEHLFSMEYPIIYKTNVRKKEDAFESNLVDSEEKCELSDLEKKSAIDTALENNQIRATNCIISHITKYQNNFAYSFLFEHSMISLISKGIEVNQLLNSEIFYHRFDFQDWPSIHSDPSKQIVPYNDSMFNIRRNYDGMFKNISKEKSLTKKPVYDDVSNNTTLQHSMSTLAPLARSDPHQKIYKIKYTLNILPSVCESPQHGTLMNACCVTDDLSIFDCPSLENYINFKWKLARKTHRIMLLFHFVYFIVFSTYICLVYTYHEEDINKIMRLFLVMCICLVFPLIYDMSQMWNEGIRVYFSSIWNYLDQAYIWLGYINIYMQYKFMQIHHQAENTTDKAYLKELHKTKTMMIVITFFILVKTFFFLRIFKQLSYMVSMMSQVLKDLGVFILFYLILIWVTTLIFNVLELGNFEKSRSANLRKITKNPTYPGKEYQYLPAFLKQALSVIRISLGDFDFAESSELDPYQNRIFWIVWLFIVLVTCIIFLNFIIAEVSASYEKVKVRLHGLFLKERAAMIQEAEEMRSLFVRNLKSDLQNFPKFLIIREVEQ